jgi:hypothetical protein
MTPRARFGRSLSRFLGRWRHRPARHRPARHRQTRHRPARCWRGRSLRRDLRAMEDALAVEAPKLASMFEVFNLLTRYERPVGIESLRWSAPLVQASLMSRRARGPREPVRPRRLAAIAALVALAVVASVCIALSTQLRPAARSCLVATPAGFGYSVSRAPGCVPYPANK